MPRRTSQSNQAAATPSYLNVFVTEQFDGRDGEKQTNYVKVGAAFPHSKGSGFNVEITKGISVGGQLVVLPPRPREDNGG